MEILAELVLQLLLWLAEILLQVLFEALAEFGMQALGAPFKRKQPVSPWVAALGYIVYGALVGAISLWFFPLAYLQSKWARVANLAVTPLVAGLLMSLVGAWRRRKGQDLVRLDRFSYGVLFALAMGLVRFFFADIG